jgi:16S rRNA (uracil1498-N3)-methyltransferase
MHNEQHLFFIHEPELDLKNIHIRSIIHCSPKTSLRISTILRMRAGEQITLFSGATLITIELTTVLTGKKVLASGIVEKIETRTASNKHLVMVCGVVKASTFEEICYSSTQLGVTQIIPVKTEKSYTRPYSNKEFIKFQAQCIAAAEQSKQIFLPIISPVISFSEFEKTIKADQNIIFFEADGAPLTQTTKKNTNKDLVVVFGPEGGLSKSEQQKLEVLGAHKTGLVSAVLRTQDAVIVGLGALQILK